MMLQVIESAEQWVNTELKLLENPDYMTSKEHLITILKFIDDLGLSNMYTSAMLSNQAVNAQARLIENYANVMNLATAYLQAKDLEGDMQQWLIGTQEKN